jgi:hypothetical protein
LGDLAPFYLRAREARQADAENAAGEAALAQFGSRPPQPEDEETVSVQTDVSKINPREPGLQVEGAEQVKPPAEPEIAPPVARAHEILAPPSARPAGPRQKFTPPPEKRPAGTATATSSSEAVRGKKALPEGPQPLSEQLRASGAAPGHVQAVQAAERLGEYIANVDTVAELQTKLASPEGVDLLTAAGISVPFLNAVMHTARVVLKSGEVPEPYATIGEYAAAILVPSRVAAGMAKKAAGAAKQAPLDAEGFKGLLQRGQYAILSGEKAGLPPEENVARTHLLARTLKERGHKAIEAEGRYGGTPEKSFVVPGMSEDEALELGAKFDPPQESVLTPRGLVYLEDRSANPADLSKIDFSGTQTDYFTSVRIGDQDVKFTIPIDFEKKIPAAAAGMVDDVARVGTQRLYRAEGPTGEGPYGQNIYAGEGEGKPQGKFFTASEETARGYLKDIPEGGRISYLDVEGAEQYAGKLAGEFLVPEDLAKGRRVLGGPQDVVEKAGMQWVGASEDLDGKALAWFNDPKTGSTLMVPAEGLTPEIIAAKVAESRRDWGLTPGGFKNEEAAPAASLLLSKTLGAERATQRIGETVADAGHAGLIGEEGRSKVGTALILGRAVVGALVGGTMGDTPEERFRNALAGVGIAGVAPAAVAKATRWLVEHAPALRNAVRKPVNQYPPEVGQELDRLFAGYEAELAAFRRGVRPHAQAWEEAEQLIRSGRMGLDEVRAAFPGMTLNDAEAGAFIKTVAQYGAQVQAFAAGLQDVVRAGQPLSPEQLDQLLTRLYTMREFLPRPAGVVAEAGRTLSFMNEPMHGLNQYLAQWHQLFTDPSKAMTPEKLVDIIAGFTRADQHAALARAQQEPGWAQMAIEALYGSLLGNPVTQTVNALMDTVALAYAPIERAGAAAMGDAVHWTEPFALLYGYVRAVPKAFAYARHTLMTGERQIAGYAKVEQPTGPVSGVTSEWLERTLLGKIAETAVPVAIAGGMYAEGWSPETAALTGLSLHPRFWPLGPRAMTATDELFKTMLYEGEKWAQAVRRGAEIASPNLRRQKVLEVVQNPNSYVQASAERFANEFTFNNPPGPLLKGLVEGMNDPNFPGAYKVLAKTVVPFTNVPNNLFKFVGRRMPGLQQLHAGWLADLQTPGAKQDTALGQLALGAAWLAVVADWAAGGGVTGSGPADPNQMREWISDGNQEYSVAFGDKTFSINRADPFGQMAAIIADWSAIAAHIDDATNDQIAAALLMVVSKDMMSKSYFEGGSNFLEAITNKDPNKAYHWLYQYTGTAIPTLVKQQRHHHDPYLREVRDLVDSAMNRVPEFSKHLSPRKNIFADPIFDHEPIGYGIDFVNPFKMRTKKDDPAVKAVLENRISASMPSWAIYGNPDKTWTLDPQRETVGVPLNHALRDELIDNIGRPLKKAWLEYVNGKEYQPNNLGPDSQNALVFRELHRRFRRAGVAQLIDRHPELLKSLEDALARRAQAVAEPQAPRQPAGTLSILERLQGAGAPAGATQ